MSAILYPTKSDLDIFIRSMGVLDEETIDTAIARMRLDRKALAAWQEWEKRTGWRPFLTTSTTPTARTFDPPGPNKEGIRRGGGRILTLSAGLLSLTSVYAGVTIDSAGVELHEGGDFFQTDGGGLYNFAVEGRPAERIEFAMPQVGPPSSYIVTGVWGRTASLDEDVWTAILQYGAALCQGEIKMQITRGYQSMEDGGARVSWNAGGESTFDRMRKQWLDDWDYHILRNIRVEA